MKKFLLFAITTASLSASTVQNSPLQMLAPASSSLKIAVHNRPLAKINGQTISVMDVKKKMDRTLKERNLAAYNDLGTRYQYYSNYWKFTLQEMINSQLMAKEAEELHLKITDGDIHQEMQRTYGPNINEKIAEIGLTYEEAEQETRLNIITQSLGWFKVWSIANKKVSPEIIKGAYLAYVGGLPNNDTWTYQTLTVRGSDGANCEKCSEEIESFIKTKEVEDFNAVVNHFKDTLPEGVTMSASKDLSLTSHELSEAHLTILKALPINAISAPKEQKTRIANSHVKRFFQLKGYERAQIPTFASMEEKIKNELVNKEASALGDEYFSKLRVKYCVEDLNVEKMFDANYQPFTIE